MAKRRAVGSPRSSAISHASEFQCLAKLDSVLGKVIDCVAQPDGIDERGHVAGAPGHVDRLGGQRQPSVGISVVGALEAQQCEQAGPVGAVGVSEAFERPCHHLNALVVDRTDSAGSSSAVPQGGSYQEVDGVDIVGEMGRREQGLTISRITGLSLGIAEPE